MKRRVLRSYDVHATIEIEMEADADEGGDREEQVESFIEEILDGEIKAAAGNFLLVDAVSVDARFLEEKKSDGAEPGEVQTQGYVIATIAAATEPEPLAFHAATHVHIDNEWMQGIIDRDAEQIARFFEYLLRKHAGGGERKDEPSFGAVAMKIFGWTEEKTQEAFTRGLERNLFSDAILDVARLTRGDS